MPSGQALAKNSQPKSKWLQFKEGPGDFAGAFLRAVARFLPVDCSLFKLTQKLALKFWPKRLACLFVKAEYALNLEAQANCNGHGAPVGPELQQ